MEKVLVIFASQGDESVFNPILNGLKKESIPFDFHICSVHRNPELLDPLLKGKFSYVISGAGLSAALPGAIASHITRPVIGVPCSGNYKGLDALLSIMQMPPGIPVLSVGVNRIDPVIANAKKLQRKYVDINIIDTGYSRAQENAERVLREFDIIAKKSTHPDKNAVNIQFVNLDDEVKEAEELIINCPLLLDEDDTAEAALNVLNQSIHGLWVGLNNGANAAIAAIQILNQDGKWDSMLELYRKKRKAKEQVVA
ncbi:AIR carboxylase family protein [Candidatus Woesearchaeota archaeon]|nr:AIR carboxylase family protein [Candidatus Woesearchaeota archaeon]